MLTIAIPFVESPVFPQPSIRSGFFRPILALIFGLMIASDAFAQGTLLGVPKRRDVVFDHAGKYLYISTSDGLVKRYNLASHQFDGSYSLGGSLRGIDIDQTDSLLVVAQTAQFVFHKINLVSGTVTNIPYTPANDEEAGGWDVAIAANGKAFVTTMTSFLKDNPIREIDLASNTVKVRVEFFPAFAFVYRGVDGSRLYFLDTDTSEGTVFTYTTDTDSFDPGVSVNAFLNISSAAVNRDGTLVGTRVAEHAAVDTAPDFKFVQPFHHVDSGVAFDGMKNIFYGVDSTTDSIIAFDIANGAELYRLAIGEDVDRWQSVTATGELVASPDGRYLALQTPAGIRLFNLPTVVPSPTPAAPPSGSTFRDMVFNQSGSRLYISTRDGFIWPYRTADGVYEQPYYLAGTLNGLDIAPDDSFLLVAQQNDGVREGVFQKLDLATGAILNIPFPRTEVEDGGGDVVIASNGNAYGITVSEFGGGGGPYLHTIDLGINQEVSRSLFSEAGQLTRSSDRTHVGFLSELGFVIFDASTNTSHHVGELPPFNPTFILNRDGTLAGTRIANSAFLNSSDDLSVLHTFDQISGGIVFDATRDRIYGVNAMTDQISGFNTGTFAEEVRIPIGEHIQQPQPLGIGNLIASPDGRYVAVFTGARLKLFDVTNAPAPTPTPTPTPVPAATPVVSVGTTIPGTAGNIIVFNVGAAHNTNRPIVVNYSFTGTAQFGTDYVLEGSAPQSGTVLIPVGSDSAQLTMDILPSVSGAKRKKKTVIMTILPGEGYKVARPPKAKIKIFR